MYTIEQLRGLEILDSRGRPTVRASCALAGGAYGTASVPSGASTGRSEALELRDGDPSRYRGLGCRRAVANVEGELAKALTGTPLADQRALDDAMIRLEGTPDKSRLGANAILAVSIAFARAVAADQETPLYSHFATVLDRSLRALPRPTINLFSGGKHAGGQVPIQDVLLVPIAARTMDEALGICFDVYQSATALIASAYGMRALTADEGGLAPPFPCAERMLEDAVAAIRGAGMEPGRDVALAVDLASSQFFDGATYNLGDERMDSAGMVERLSRWLAQYPILSVEDGLAEEDWVAWPALVRAVGTRALVLGDDLLCTNPGRIRRAIDARAATALLLKVNQIGTLSEAADAYRLARDAGWSITISARSGETEDAWLADLAVGWGGDQIKIGSLAHGERLAKYNRLLEIEAETGLPLASWPNPLP